MTESGWNKSKREFKSFGRYLLVLFGLDNAVTIGLALVVSPLLIREPWNFATGWSLPVTASFVLGLRQVGVTPSVRHAWTFGLAALFGYFCLFLVGIDDGRLSGSLFPVVRGLLTYVAVLAFAGFVAGVGADDVRQLAKTEQ